MVRSGCTYFWTWAFQSSFTIFSLAEEELQRGHHKLIFSFWSTAHFNFFTFQFKAVIWGGAWPHERGCICERKQMWMQSRGNAMHWAEAEVVLLFLYHYYAGVVNTHIYCTVLSHFMCTSLVLLLYLAFVTYLYCQTQIIWKSLQLHRILPYSVKFCGFGKTRFSRIKFSRMTDYNVISDFWQFSR